MTLNWPFFQPKSKVGGEATQGSSGGEAEQLANKQPGWLSGFLRQLGLGKILGA